MKTSSLIRLLALVPLFAMVVACTSLTREIEQVDEQSAKLTTQVKSALIADKSVDAAAILVTRNENGSIVLSGFVENEEEHQKVVELSRGAAPEIEVVDELEVR